MSIASEILRIQQAKQAIKESINDKGGTLTNESIDNYAQAIDNLPSGGGGGMTFATAWQKHIDSKNVIYDIEVTLAAPNQEMGFMNLDLYIGDSDLTQLYNDCVNEVIPLTSDVYLINNVAVKYFGEISDTVGFPIPLFQFGHMEDANGFIIGDMTPLGMGLGISLAKITSVTIPNNKLTIQQGFDYEEPSGIILPDSVISIDAEAFYNWVSNNQPLVIPNSVTSIEDGAFRGWSSNNQPLVIPNSVTNIGDRAFENWLSNNQPLVIPNSVTSIGSLAFGWWEANNQPLTIPNSVTSIGNYAFDAWQQVPYVEMQSITPPTIASSLVFFGQNDAPIYVPDASVDDYKTATNWASLSSRIFSINDK